MVEAGYWASLSAGRTGRAGRKGVCVLIVPARRHSAAARVLGYAAAPFSLAMLGRYPAPWAT